MPQTINLIELFTERVFRIPDYQRGYAWKEKQLSELWEDLEEIYGENGEFKKHYTGTIFIKEIHPESNEKWFTAKYYDIVDGQQRLTTIVILIFELLKQTKTGYCERRKSDLLELFIAKNNLSGTSEVYKFGYSSENHNNKYLQNKIFENDKIILGKQFKNSYTENLLFAKNYFSKKILELNNNQKEELFEKIINSLQFDLRPIEIDLDVQSVFETMNNRGKPLTILEKLKNRLIYLCEKLKDSSTEDKELLRDKINEAWGSIFVSLAQNPNNVLDEDELLSAHLSLYKEPEQTTFSENETEIKLFCMFCNRPEKYKEEKLTYQTIENYILSLSEMAPIWYKIHFTIPIVQNILLLNGSKEVKILLTSLFLKIQDNDILHNILFLIEKLFFRNSVPGMNVVNINYDSAIHARDIYNGNDINNILLYLNEKISIPIDTEKVIDGFKWLFSYERGPKGFHRWSSLKYFLFKYENFLKEKYGESDDKLLFSSYNSTSIEHIMPQQYWDYWSKEIDDYAKRVKEDEKNYAIKVLLNSIGNLTILKNGKNSGLGNKSWQIKQKRFSTGSYSEIEISKYKHWNYENIKERGENIIKVLAKIIQNDFIFNEDEVKKILFDNNEIINTIYKGVKK